MRLVVRQLLRDADALLDGRPRLLRLAARVRSLDASARWMRLAMRAARGERIPPIVRPLGGVVARKYAARALVTLASAIAILALGRAWLLPACVPVFYMVEARRAFDLPLAIDRSVRRAGRSLVATSGGRGRATLATMTIAASMVFGGAGRRGVLRAWCRGCVAVVIWYERARRAAADDLRSL